MHVYFVDYKPTALFNEAYDAMDGMENADLHRLKPNEVIEKFKKTDKHCFFVFSCFEGKVFDHVKKLKMAIYGPNVLLESLSNNKCLPKVSFPLKSTCLEKVLVCFTAITDDDRGRLREQIEMMHGNVANDLTTTVNILVSSSVGTAKFRVAAGMNIAIVLQTYITELWNLSSTTAYLDPLDKNLLDKFRVPIFHNLQLCVSGLSNAEREQAKQVIVKNGGQYLPDLTLGHCTHLICKRACGQKYNYADKWKIQIVSCQWLHDSIEKGFALDEAKYTLPSMVTNMQMSTPTSPSSKHRKLDQKGHELSLISINHVDETIIINDDEVDMGQSSGEERQAIWTGCVVSLLGCKVDFVDKWTHLIESNGGKVCRNVTEEISDDVTHKIVGSEVRLDEMDDQIEYVTDSWLQACLDGNRLVDTKEYAVDTSITALAATADVPMDHLASWDSMDHYMDHDTSKEPKKTATNLEHTILPTNGSLTAWDSMGHYMDHDTSNKDATNLEHTILPTNGPLTSWDSKDHHMDHGTSKEPNKDATNLEHTILSPNEPTPFIEQYLGIFHDMSFFLDESLTEERKNVACAMITSNGGSIIQSSSTDATYHVTPDVFPRAVKLVNKNGRLVTLFFVEACVKFQSLVEMDKDFMYRPLVVSDKKIMAGTVISFSGYPAEERKILKMIANQVGAVVQDQMSRKAIPEKKIVATTHLIIGKVDKKKYPSSCSWRIPAVTKHWLGACIHQCQLADTGQYLLQPDNNMSIISTFDGNNLNETCMTVANMSTESLVPLQKTPVVNKNLQIRNNKQLDASFGDSPIMRKCTDGPRRLNVDSLKDIFKTPEYCHVRYPTKELAMTTPEMQAALKCRLALLKIEGDNKNTNNLLDTSLSAVDAPPPLSSLTIYISKSSQSHQISLKNIIESLGGIFSWIYKAKEVTHVVCCNNAYSSNTMTRRNLEELEQAVKDNKTLVSSDWLNACNEERRFVNTDRYLVSITECMKMDQSESSTSTASRKRKASEQIIEETIDGHTRTGMRVKLSDNDDSKELTMGEKPVWQHNTSIDIEETQLNDGAKFQKVVMFIKLDKEDKIKYVREVEKLGGICDLGECLTANTTHLICLEPGRSEKYMSAIASGKWVLHISYIDDSMNAGKWLEETDYEWGGTRMMSQYKDSLSSVLLGLAEAAKRLRQIGGGAFSEWRVAIVDSSDKVDKMSKIIKIGGGTVLPINPLPNPKHVTHILINRKCCSGLPDLSSYSCYSLDFILYFLSARNESENKKIVKKFFISPKEMSSLVGTTEPTVRSSRRSKLT